MGEAPNERGRGAPPCGRAAPIARANYLNLQNFFDPYAFDAAEWVRIAKDAGMKYVIITSRHHDGFSNWATAQSEWNSGDETQQNLGYKVPKKGVFCGT